MKKRIKVLHIVINDNSNKYYNQMFNMLDAYYSIYDGHIKTFFVSYSIDLDTKYRIIGQTLDLQGRETYIPGILWKTIDSILILSEFYDFDYILRSNISSVINFEELFKILRAKAVNYLAGRLLSLNWIDEKSGVYDNKWFGTNFAQGTFILMSRQLVDFILENRHKIRSDLIDDLAIGVFIQEHLPNLEINYLTNNKFFELNDILCSKKQIIDFNKTYLPVVWRNKSFDRQIDVMNIDTITTVLKGNPPTS